MKTNQRNALTLALALFLTGCGGGGGGGGSESGSTSKSPPTSTGNTGTDSNTTPGSEPAPVPASSKKIIAAQNFDFKLDRQIQLQIASFPSDSGKLNIYEDYAYHDTQLGTFYPDHTTRVASFVAMTNFHYPVSVTGENRYLILEWLPMDGLSNEAYVRVNLNSNTQYVVSFQ